MQSLYSQAENVAFLLGEEDIPEGNDEMIYVADLLSSNIYNFSGSAAVIWCLLAEKPITLEQLVHEVAVFFGEAPQQVHNGVSDFVQQLINLNLVRTN